MQDPETVPLLSHIKMGTIIKQLYAFCLSQNTPMLKFIICLPVLLSAGDKDSLGGSSDNYLHIFTDNLDYIV